MVHQPVLLNEVIKYLNPKSGDNFVDCTVDGGGHSLALLEKNKPDGQVLGIDLDKTVLDYLKNKIEGTELNQRFILIHRNYIFLNEIIEEYNFKPIQGILLDLGMSLWQIDSQGRGFSFLRDEPLDMRYDPESNSLTAEVILNNWPEEKIQQILEDYGEERFAPRIAQKIIEVRKVVPIKTTGQLVEIIREVVSAPYRHQRIHFATRTFQALRIAVNQELDNLITVLPQIIKVLHPGGRAIIISFHSLEDRIVKNFIQEKEQEQKIKSVLPKVIQPTFEEIFHNPASRSAKMRVFEKIKPEIKSD